jgi:hypothetical protein
LALAHRIPLPGEELALEDGTVLQIVEASARQVRTIRLLPSNAEPRQRLP